jgi:ribA/ribD-fused uncharacterized protein
MLDLKTLINRSLNGESFDYVYFWGHQTWKSWEITKCCCSQWYPSPFIVRDTLYATAEHWMMASKARLFEDDETLAQIIDSTDPREAKELGRKVRNFDSTRWTKEARRIVTEGNKAKFEQSAELRAFLVSTGDAVLVEASPHDNIWGIGLQEDDERAKHPQTWLGKNLLGFALMDVREALQ